MIRYDLICDKGHDFDGWFRDSAAYDEQAAQGPRVLLGLRLGARSKSS